MFVLTNTLVSQLGPPKPKFLASPLIPPLSVGIAVSRNIMLIPNKKNS